MTDATKLAERALELAEKYRAAQLAPPAEAEHARFSFIAFARNNIEALATALIEAKEESEARYQNYESASDRATTLELELAEAQKRIAELIDAGDYAIAAYRDYPQDVYDAPYRWHEATKDFR